MSVAVPVVDTWDGSARRIYLKQGVTNFHWVDDIYREYRYWRANTDAAQLWAPLLKASGNDPKGGNKYTPRFITLLDGTRVVPYDENILITVTGEAITDNADIDPDPFDTTTRTQAIKLYLEPPAAEIVRADKELLAIQRMSYDNKIHIDPLNGVSGTTYDIGTPGNPVNNMTDAHAIGDSVNLFDFKILSNMTLGSEDVSHGHKFYGRSPMNALLTINPDANVLNAEFIDLYVQGTVDGGNVFRECIIGAINYVNGFIYKCTLQGPIMVNGGVNISKCWISPYATDLECIIDFDNTPGICIVTQWEGGTLIIKNMVSGCVFGVGGTAGSFVIDSSCTGGFLNFGGAIRMKGYDGVVDSINNASIAAQVWSFTG